MQAVIMAGGKGTRVASICETLPKPMFSIDGKPLLEHHIKKLSLQGIKDIYIVIGHLGNVIKEYFQDGSRFGVQIRYFEEEEPLGTAGALPLIAEELEDVFFLIFGDVYADVCYPLFLQYHQAKNADITLFAHPNSHPFDSDLLVCDGTGKVLQWKPKNSERNRDYRNVVNAGLYVISKCSLLHAVSSNCSMQNRKRDMERDFVFPLIVQKGAVFAYRSTEYIKDMGTEERYQQVKNDVATGIPEKRNLSKKQKCIFLDRDGTINQFVGFLTHKEQMVLMPGAAEAIKWINQSEYLCIVITNQPVVARGDCSFKELEEIHTRLETLLGNQNAYLDDLYFCPHHPHKGFDGEQVELKIQCQCRKPGIQMFLDAAEKYNIDLKESYMIGDSTVDIAAGRNAGVKTVLLHTGQAGTDGNYTVRADYEFEDLKEAISNLIVG